MSLTPRTLATASLAGASLACLLFSGCRVTTDDHGDKKNVDISTPFGGMKVNTNNSSDTTAIGLSAYPGAVPVKDSDDKDGDGNNADVNLSFGDFHLGVKAATFQTSDSSDKVIAFYRKDLGKRYGDVITCKGSKTVGMPVRTSQGLGCDDNGTHISTGDHGHKGFAITSGDQNSGSLELRAGSQQHQHIVGVEPKDGGTKIGLVSLDLPSHLGNHDSKSIE
ncbi:hypothetical protein GOB94_10340 [Granulicella sp. 5B5]|uniref:hypothetical protein n=1 Tax=Granulicella sp. 5B5 TaxID=1617967 RepID=UPI0015F60484|nr:hypothetical protein [Granulicella sp. 5B5]QMV19029.1 hypothetical protein GOB94_10340 [Granulicella sp. 5B5]